MTVMIEGPKKNYCFEDALDLTGKNLKQCYSLTLVIFSCPSAALYAIKCSIKCKEIQVFFAVEFS